MVEFTSIEDLAKDIQLKLDMLPTQNSMPQSVKTKKKVVTLYAFNATGKTRISNILSEKDAQEDTTTTLCYNAFLEDMFTWDNENYILKFDPHSWIVKLIKDEALDYKIIDNFNDIVSSNIEPAFDWEKGEISFVIASGDDDSATNIKISRGEESMLIRSLFYTILQTAIDVLNEEREARTTEYFNDLQYIIIDDPVSSIDDTKIIAMALKLIDAIKKSKSETIKFLITTHHAFFYSILVNSFTRLKKKGKCEFESYILAKKNYQFELKRQSDSPFSYHLSIKETIQTAIDTNTTEKYHFNLFRNLLEKTSNFLGYSDWSECIIDDNNKERLKNLVQSYSHSKLSDLESRELSSEDKILLQDTFSAFLLHFNWK